MPLAVMWLIAHSPWKGLNLLGLGLTLTVNSLSGPCSTTPLLIIWDMRFEAALPVSFSYCKVWTWCCSYSTMESLASMSASFCAAASFSALIWVKVRLRLELILSMFADTPLETILKNRVEQLDMEDFKQAS